MALTFKFDPNQQFQLDAIEAVVDLFDGQAFNDLELVVPEGASFAAIPNRLSLGGEALLDNLRRVQERNLPERLRDGELYTIGAEGGNQPPFYNFSVEMETGTGKTYVYLRTALELHRRYGFRKFIVVVPSIAICEGVLKTLEITAEHFRELFGNIPYRWCKYASADLNQVRSFALGDGVEIMVMTLASFNKEINVLLRSTDRLQGEVPVNLLRATSPILILDEPQNMESEISREALLRLNPLFALRYSATHREPYNLVYRLTPAEAYEQGLVKRIEVASVVSDAARATPYISLQSVRARKTKITARMRVHVLSKSGEVSEKAVTVGVGDDLRDKTNRAEYAGYEVEELDAAEGTVTFTNGETLHEGGAIGVDKEPIFREQIRETVRLHMARQAGLRERGVKVLSLFFIDKVANYAEEDGLIRRIFAECFAEEAARHDAWSGLTPDQVSAAYFAEQRRRDGSVDRLDSKTGEAAKDEAAYELIMRNKERLLAFDEPVSFIFSHSALREGWDNPNVFQICTLNETVSDMRKRQEIGRGVRIPVDQSGRRITDDESNILTVIANEHYEQYVGRLQAELEFDGFLSDEQGPPPRPSRDPVRVQLRDEFVESEDFRRLWEKISRRTRYAVEVDGDRLADDVLRRLRRVDIPEPRITVSHTEVQIGEDGVDGVLRSQRSVEDTPVGEAPDLLAMLSQQLEHTSPPCRLTRRTLVAIITDDEVLPKALRNPPTFVAEAARVIRAELFHQIIDGIKYLPLDEWYEMSQVFEREIEGREWNTIPARLSVYDHVVYDSSVEKRFAEDLDERDDIRLYVKLPRAFTVTTPVGEYNPDWAIVVDQNGEERVYLVRETKQPTELDRLRRSEARKVKCGKRHFEALGVSFKVVTSADEILP